MNFWVDSLLWTKHGFITYTCETKKQLKQWISSDEPAPKKAKTIKSAGKVMATVLGCTRYNSYRLSSVETNDQWRLLRSLIGSFQQHLKKNVPIWRKRRYSSIKTMHGFTRALMIKFNEFRYELLLPHPAFARFSLLRLFLVFKSKEMVRRKRKRFTTREQLIAETEAYFEELDKSYYSDGLKKLDKVYRTEKRCWEIKTNRLKKCVLLCFSKNLLTCRTN